MPRLKKNVVPLVELGQSLGRAVSRHRRLRATAFVAENANARCSASGVIGRIVWLEFLTVLGVNAIQDGSEAQPVE